MDPIIRSLSPSTKILLEVSIVGRGYVGVKSWFGNWSSIFFGVFVSDGLIVIRCSLLVFRSSLFSCGEI